MTLSGNGNMGVGKTAPTEKVDVVGNINASGHVIAQTNLKSMNSSGDEGGEIFLNAPQTSTTIPTGVTIDVYQNKLRFFCQGGSANGYYLDMPSGGAGVATNLSPAGYTGTVSIIQASPNPPKVFTIVNGIITNVT